MSGVTTGFTDTSAGEITCYCPTYLAISANCPADIFPNQPINAGDGGLKINFSNQMQERDGNGVVINDSSDYDKKRTIGMMQTLNWRRQVPQGWRDAGKHYLKYRVMSSSISIDLVPQPLVGSEAIDKLEGTVAIPGSTLNVEKYLEYGQGSDAVTSVLSLHQQHFRMPGDQFKELPIANSAGDDRRFSLKRIITAGTIHKRDFYKDGEIDKDSKDYDKLELYKYYPPADTTANFHRRWPKTKQYVIPAFVDKISPWSHPKKRHLFRSSWKCPKKHDAEEREEYEAFLTPLSFIDNNIAGDTADTSLADDEKQADHKFSGNAQQGRVVPQREQMYIIRIGGQDVTYSTVKDTIAQQSNHASHTLHVRVSYNVMFFERKKDLNTLEETLDTTNDNNAMDSARIRDMGHTDENDHVWDFGEAERTKYTIHPTASTATQVHTDR